MSSLSSHQTRIALVGHIVRQADYCGAHPRIGSNDHGACYPRADGSQIQTGMSDRLTSCKRHLTPTWSRQSQAHLELKELWVQDKVDKAELEVRKMGTDTQSILD